MKFKWHRGREGDFRRWDISARLDNRMEENYEGNEIHRFIVYSGVYQTENSDIVQT